MSLEDYGWSPELAQEYCASVESAGLSAASVEPARVVFFSREHYRVRCAEETLAARLAGRFRKEADRPVVGDWVVLERPSATNAEARVTLLLPRRTKLSRKVPGERTREQVVAANMDAVFLVMGLDGDFNLRRMERFLAMARQSGALPACVLTKADLSSDVPGQIAAVQAVAGDAPVLAVCAPEGVGLEPLEVFLGPGHTVVLVGSSGAGKSTLLNRLCGSEVMRTGNVRDGDDRGRHTTTHRELVRLPQGGLLIDNPGIRELQLWAEDDPGHDDAFEDIVELAESCRFRDCAHGAEPGCAVREAVERGDIDASRLANMQSLGREQRYLSLRQDDATRRRSERKQAKFYKNVMEEKKRRDS